MATSTTGETEPRATERQWQLLQFLSRTEWRRAPVGTKGATLVSLWNRGLIEGRMLSSYATATRYSDAYEWRRI